MNRKYYIYFFVAVLLAVPFSMFAQEYNADKLYVKRFFAEYKNNKRPPAIEISMFFVTGIDTIEVKDPLSISNVYFPIDNTTRLIITTNYYTFEVSNIQQYIIPNVEYLIGIGVSRTKECLQVIYYDQKHKEYVTYAGRRKCNIVKFNTDLKLNKTKFTLYK